MSSFDVAVVGGGFYGSYLAWSRSRFGARVALFEREPALLRRASYKNQARIHKGYHYPRSFRTAVRARSSFPRFTSEFSDCIDGSFEHYYAIARRFSKVSAAHFEHFCGRIGAPIVPARDGVASLFSTQHIEGVYRVEEPAFDADALRAEMETRLAQTGVDVRCGREVVRVDPVVTGGIEVTATHEGRDDSVTADEVICCTYSRLNRLLENSGLPTEPLKHEIAEIALVEPPETLRGLGVTVMCGPFFSCIPFPGGGHSLSHVRYTPHAVWHEDGEHPAQDAYEVLSQYPKKTRVRSMIQDAARYLPSMRDARYLDSLWEVKTVLPRNETNDGRPTLVLRDHGMPGLTCVLGAKIDSIYEVERYLEPPAPTR